jgi:4'-phosphopantetheinyl transferase
MALPEANEVHVWAVDLARSKGEVDALALLLSSDELRRAANMRIEAGRRRWIVARAGLRGLLGAYLGEEPASVALVASTRGKPRLDPPSELRFSLAHSAELALVAGARGREVGVDLEWTAKPRDAAGLARRWFADAERAAIEEAAEAERQGTFYRHWVAKEAFVKATGRGVAASLRSFEVALDGPGGPRLVHVGGDAVEALRWSLAELALPGGYAGAVVVEGSARVRPLAGFDPLAQAA